jgi:hypothetical protein
MPQASTEHLYIPARNVRPFPKEKVTLEAAKRLGVGVQSMGIAMDMADIYKRYAADALQTSVTTPNIATPIQFLQNWLPGQVYVMTAARKADDLMGIATIGSYEDEEIVQPVLENIGYAKPYGDYTNVPFAEVNQTYEFRTLVRFEQGLRVGSLEEMRSSRAMLNLAATRRQSAGLSLEISRNLVAFNGYNSGNDKTYGFLSDPNLPAYVTVPNGAAGSPLWANKTFLEITADIRASLVGLRTTSKGVIDPSRTPITLALPTNCIDYLSVVSDFGVSVWQWLNESYPKVRVQDAVQLDAANGGANVFYAYADEVSDFSTDGGRVWLQVVPTKFMVVGVAKLAKGFVEDYANATAGAMCKRPWAVYRATGI